MRIAVHYTLPHESKPLLYRPKTAYQQRKSDGGKILKLLVEKRIQILAVKVFPSFGPLLKTALPSILDELFSCHCRQLALHELRQAVG